MNTRHKIGRLAIDVAGESEDHLVRLKASMRALAPRALSDAIDECCASVDRPNQRIALQRLHVDLGIIREDEMPDAFLSAFRERFASALRTACREARNPKPDLRRLDDISTFLGQGLLPGEPVGNLDDIIASLARDCPDVLADEVMLWMSDAGMRQRMALQFQTETLDMLLRLSTRRAASKQDPLAPTSPRDIDRSAPCLALDAPAGVVRTRSFDRAAQQAGLETRASPDPPTGKPTGDVASTVCVRPATFLPSGRSDTEAARRPPGQTADALLSHGPSTAAYACLLASLSPADRRAGSTASALLSILLDTAEPKAHQLPPRRGGLRLSWAADRTQTAKESVQRAGRSDGEAAPFVGNPAARERSSLALRAPFHAAEMVEQPSRSKGAGGNDDRKTLSSLASLAVLWSRHEAMIARLAAAHAQAGLGTLSHASVMDALAASSSLAWQTRLQDIVRIVAAGCDRSPNAYHTILCKAVRSPLLFRAARPQAQQEASPKRVGQMSERRTSPIASDHRNTVLHNTSDPGARSSREDAAPPYPGPAPAPRRSATNDTYFVDISEALETLLHRRRAAPSSDAAGGADLAREVAECLIHRPDALCAVVRRWSGHPCTLNAVSSALSHGHRRAVAVMLAGRHSTAIAAMLDRDSSATHALSHAALHVLARGVHDGWSEAALVHAIARAASSSSADKADDGISRSAASANGAPPAAASKRSAPTKPMGAAREAAQTGPGDITLAPPGANAGVSPVLGPAMPLKVRHEATLRQLSGKAAADGRRGAATLAVLAELRARGRPMPWRTLVRRLIRIASDRLAMTRSDYAVVLARYLEDGERPQRWSTLLREPRGGTAPSFPRKVLCSASLQPQDPLAATAARVAVHSDLAKEHQRRDAADAAWVIAEALRTQPAEIVAALRSRSDEPALVATVADLPPTLLRDLASGLGGRHRHRLVTLLDAASGDRRLRRAVAAGLLSPKVSRKPWRTLVFAIARAENLHRFESEDGPRPNDDPAVSETMATRDAVRVDRIIGASAAGHLATRDPIIRTAARQPAIELVDQRREEAHRRQGWVEAVARGAANPSGWPLFDKRAVRRLRSAAERKRMLDTLRTGSDRARHRVLRSLAPRTSGGRASTSKAEAARRHEIDAFFAALGGPWHGVGTSAQPSHDLARSLRRHLREVIERFPHNPPVRDAMARALARHLPARDTRRLVRRLAGRRARLVMAILDRLLLAKPGRDDPPSAQASDLADVLLALLSERARSATVKAPSLADVLGTVANRVTDRGALDSTAIPSSLTSDRRKAARCAADQAAELVRQEHGEQRDPLDAVDSAALAYFLWFGSLPAGVGAPRSSTLRMLLQSRELQVGSRAHPPGSPGVAARLKRLATRSGEATPSAPSPKNAKGLSFRSIERMMRTPRGCGGLADEMERGSSARRRILARLDPLDLPRRESSSARRDADVIVQRLTGFADRARGTHPEEPPLAALIRRSPRALARRLSEDPSVADAAVERLTIGSDPPILKPLIRVLAGRHAGLILRAASASTRLGAQAPAEGAKLDTDLAAVHWELVRALLPKRGESLSRAHCFALVLHAVATLRNQSEAPVPRMLEQTPRGPSSVRQAAKRSAISTYDPNGVRRSVRAVVDPVAYFVWYGSLPPQADARAASALHDLLAGTEQNDVAPPGSTGVASRLARLVTPSRDTAAGIPTHPRATLAASLPRSAQAEERSLAFDSREPDHARQMPGTPRAHRRSRSASVLARRRAEGLLALLERGRPNDHRDLLVAVRRMPRVFAACIPSDPDGARHLAAEMVACVPPRGLLPLVRALAGQAAPLVHAALVALRRPRHLVPDALDPGLRLWSDTLAALAQDRSEGVAAAGERTAALERLASSLQARLDAGDPALSAYVRRRPRLSALLQDERQSSTRSPAAVESGEARSGDLEVEPKASDILSALNASLQQIAAGRLPTDIPDLLTAALDGNEGEAAALVRGALRRRAVRHYLCNLPRLLATRVLLASVTGPGQARQVLLPLLAVDPRSFDVLFAAIGQGTTDTMALAAVLRTHRAKAAAARMPGEPTLAASSDAVIIDNAGLVLLAPFLGRFFDKLSLIGEDGRLLSGSAGRAVHLLQVLVTAEADAREHRLVLNKVLCGLDPAALVPPAIVVTEAEIDTANSLLRSVTQAWPPLANTSISGLRSTFLQRSGVLRRTVDTWSLKVERGPFDMLLDMLPWPLSIVRLRWMPQPLAVEWR